MYKKSNPAQTRLANFDLPFGGKIRADNRWVVLSEIIPWDTLETLYSESFTSSKGNRAITARVALGALIIKEKLGTTDRETVEQIKENHYLQFFLGFNGYRDEAPFDHSSMTNFRKRFSKELLGTINDEVALKQLCERQQSDDREDIDSDGDDGPQNKGKLLVDATCTPADVAYPTDLNLLNQAREKTEEIIDVLHSPHVGIKVKPRTYRHRARKNYLSVAKKKRPGKKKIRKAVRKQLGYVGRNLKSIQSLAKSSDLLLLSKRQYRNLLVIHELYRQQLQMYKQKVHSIEARIISISQPHIRPIVRGKAKASVEFGAKVSASVVDGFIFADNISWESFNEGGDLPKQVEEYKRRLGVYPQSVHADKIYVNRTNRKFCKERGIRLSGVPLGRPPKVTIENSAEIAEKKKQQRRDELERIPIEGKFGQGKRRFGLGLIMSKLARTSEVSIMISLLVMNLQKVLDQALATLILLCINIQRLFAAMRKTLSSSSKPVFAISTPEQNTRGDVCLLALG